MDLFKPWWEIAQVAGAGAAFVLGIIFWLYRQDMRRDLEAREEELREEREYIRESDKNTLEVLGKVVDLSERHGQEASKAKDEIVACVASTAHESKEELKRCVEDAVRKITDHQNRQ